MLVVLYSLLRIPRTKNTKIHKKIMNIMEKTQRHQLRSP